MDREIYIVISCVCLHISTYVYVRSVKATRENMAALRPLLPRIVELLRTGQCLAPSAAAAADGGHAHSHSHGSSNS
jgi:hypothetical protein